MATAPQDTKAQESTKAAATAPKKGEYNKALHDELKKKNESDVGLSDAEHESLIEQMSLKRSAEAEDRKKFDALVDSVVKSGFQFSRIYKAVVLKNDGMRAEVASLFNQDEITAAFKAGGGKVGTKGKGAAKKTTPAEISPEAFLNFKETGAKGRSTTLEINGDFPANFGASWKWLKSLEGGVKANLEKVMVNTPKAVDFAASSAGKAYIQELHDWVENDGKTPKAK